MENLLEGAAALVAGETIDEADLQFGVQVRAVAASSGQDLESLEREHVLRVLNSVGGNKSRAARILGINRRTIYRKFAS
jgi:transcriptional regulator of acetoin/glycerol metabolism